MLYHDFSWKGTLASSLGVIVNTQAELTRPKERVQSITVPGRGGVLHMTEGEDVYEPVLLSPACTLSPNADKQAVLAWLRGAGRLILGSEPTYAYDARLINQIPFTRLWEDAGAYMSFTPIFECQPGKYLAAPGSDLVYTVSGGSIVNPGTLKSAPRIRVEGSGDITLSVCGSYFELEDITGGVIVDSVMQDCYSLDQSLLLNDHMVGDFPRLMPGTWSVSWTGSITKITITPNWRWL